MFRYIKLVEDESKYKNNQGSSVLRKFITLHKNFIAQEPTPYYGDRDMDEVLAFFGSDDGMEAVIKTPIENIIFNHKNLYHIIYENEPERINYLGRVKATLKEPNLIIETSENKVKHNYIKAFKSDHPLDAQLVVVKLTDDGVFYVTTFNLRDNKFKKLLTEGKLIYDITDRYIHDDYIDLKKLNIKLKEILGEY